MMSPISAYLAGDYTTKAQNRSLSTDLWIAEMHDCCSWFQLLIKCGRRWVALEASCLRRGVHAQLIHSALRVVAASPLTQGQLSAAADMSLQIHRSALEKDKTYLVDVMSDGLGGSLGPGSGANKECIQLRLQGTIWRED